MNDRRQEIATARRRMGSQLWEKTVAETVLMDVYMLRIRALR